MGDILGLSKSEIDGMFKKERQIERASTKHINAQMKIKIAEAKRFMAKAKRDEKYEKAIENEADKVLKKKQEEEERLIIRKAKEEQKVIDQQIYKKYTDGATLKSLMNDYNVTRDKLAWLIKKYKIPKQTN